MASDIKAQMEMEFHRARDEYIAAITIHSDALADALKPEAADVNEAFDRASRALQRKQEAYRRATDNLRSLIHREG